VTAEPAEVKVPVPVLRCEGVVKRFGTHTVLRSVDLEVAEHQVVTLIGASGSGKSSLLRCINLLETVDDGVIRLDGEDITDPRVDADAVRRRIGVVFQAYNLFPHMTVLANVTLAPRLVGKAEKADAEERAMVLLRRVGLAEKALEYPDRLSGGQQQRVAVVRALANDPRLLLADEPTGALDTEDTERILDLLQDARERLGMTMMVVSHDSAIGRRADRMLYMRDGRLGPRPQVGLGAAQNARG
jgi:polar amino acid transport system ATP-binding protein